MKLVIVESPNKISTIRKCLGDGYEVLATAGHFRDLPEDELGVDPVTFAPTYVLDEGKRALLVKIRAAAKRASQVLLATDADREGEAISWHLAQTLRLRDPKRVRFTEITAKAVTSAVLAAGPIDQDLVDAQQARRVLDRLVGYQVSPLLRRLGTNHSAGRVQSATLHLVVAREQSREAFVPTPYWILKATYSNALGAKYATRDARGELREARLQSESDAQAVLARARGPHVVQSVGTAPVERRPKPPFTTSTLQQAASVQLRLNPARTMSIAQALFERGAITYHRTDSVRLSDEAVAMAREFIAADYPEALPPVPIIYRGKQNAQDAHEAIRPTSLGDAAVEMDSEEATVFALIRARFIACQCMPAVFAQTTVALRSGSTEWRALGAVVEFPSFFKYLPEDEDSEAKGEDADEGMLPRVSPGEVLAVDALQSMRYETKPPPRFTEASLIREMERVGIGRPATYAQAVKVLFAREYVGVEKRLLFPTQRGRLVDAVLGEVFEGLVLAEYTAKMEERLDEVAAGKRRWRDELRAWYRDFEPQLARAPLAIDREASRLGIAPDEDTRRPAGRACPRCSAPVLLRPGKHGLFLSCAEHPRCRYSAAAGVKPSERPCPKCGGAAEELAGKFGPYLRCVKDGCDGRADLSPPADEPCPLCAGAMKTRGEFLGCARYPECKGALDVRALAKARKEETRCPKCRGWLLERRGRNGGFLGCARYPSCRHAEPRRSAREGRR